VKTFRRQSGSTQKNLRVSKRMTTGTPSHGRSARRRTYRLCTFREDAPQDGQIAKARQVFSRISMEHATRPRQTNSTSVMLGTSVPERIARSGDHQSSLSTTPRNSRWEESPNVRQNQFNFAPTFWSEALLADTGSRLQVPGRCHTFLNNSVCHAAGSDERRLYLLRKCSESHLCCF
jgi:hypothetical protein